MNSYGAMVPAGLGPQVAPSNTRVPVVYQIDFTAVASGKRIASTKRRVRWRFGFANHEALAQGETGTACRGEEHDITLVWSVTSGKKLVLADGREVHCSTSRGSIFDFSWTIKGNHILKIVAHASPPLSVTPGWRQYDFFVDGQSFFLFPKVFRLGLAPGDPRGEPNNQSRGMGGQTASHGGNHIGMPVRGYSNLGYGVPPASANSGSFSVANIEAPRTPAEEDAYLQEAIKNSIQETSAPASSPGGAPAPPPQISQQGQDLLLDFFIESPTPLLAIAAAPTGYAMAPAPIAYPSQNNGAGLLALPPSTNDPYQNQPATPSYGASSGYGAPTTAFYGTTYGAPPSQFTSPPIPPAGYGAPDFTSPQAQATPSSLGFTSPQAQAGADFHHYGNPSYDPSQQFAAPPVSPYGVPVYDPSQQFAAAPAQYEYNAHYETSQQYVVAPSTQNNGFEMSSAPNQNGFVPTEEEIHVAPSPATDPAIFTMNTLSSDESNPFGASANATSDPNTSLADKAFSKFANMDTFDLVSKREAPRANPFESNFGNIGGNVPLADFKKTTMPKKDIMRSPVAAAPTAAPGALVIAVQQTGNWGTGVGGYDQYSQQPPTQHQPSYGQPAPSYVQQAPMQQPPMYGQPSPTYGQQPPIQQQVYYSQPSPTYGQQPPIQQPQYYQQPPVQQPQYYQQQF